MLASKASDYGTMMLDVFVNLWRSKVVAAYSAALSFIAYLVPPDQRLTALLLVMGFDILTRFFAESKKAGGFFKAIQSRALTSKSLFDHTFIKVLSYFILLAVANQSNYVFPKSLHDILEAYVYAFLFLVEVISNIENLIEAGAKNLGPLLLRFKKEQSDLTGAFPAAIESAATTEVTTTPVTPAAEAKPAEQHDGEGK